MAQTELVKSRRNWVETKRSLFLFNGSVHPTKPIISEWTDNLICTESVLSCPLKAINVIIIIVVIIVCPMMIIYRRIELLLWDGKMWVRKAAAKGNDSHDSCLMMTLRTEMIIRRRGNFLRADSGLFGICLWCWKGCDRTSSLLNLPFRCLYSVFWMVCLVLWTVNSIFLMIFNRGWIFVFWMVIMLFVMIIWFLKWHTSCVLNCGFGILGDILDIWDWDQSWFGLRSPSLSWVPSLPGLQVDQVEKKKKI